MYNKLLKPFLVDIKTLIIDVLFPIHCLACEKEKPNFICEDCRPQLKKLENQLCIVCQKQAMFGLTHPCCQTAWGADGLISIFDYHDQQISKIIIGGKYKFIPNAFEELGKIIADQIRSNHYPLLTNHFLIAPIPLHKTRLNWRGFNQSEILAKSIAQKLNLPVANVLKRTKITKTQKDLKKDQRQKNMKDAFMYNIQHPISYISDCNIILIDDVTTTGTTLTQAAKILKQNGAHKVICLTVARD